MMLLGTGGHVTPLITSVFALGKKSNQSRKEKQSEPSERENRSDRIRTSWDIRTIRQALWGTFPMGSRGTFLVAGVNPGLRETVAAALASRAPVHTAATPDVLRAYPFDMLLLAHRLPDFIGANVLRRINGFFPPTLIIHMTGVGSPEVAIQTLRDEARDYIRSDSRDSSPRSFREKAAARTRGFIRACPGWILDLRGRSNLPSQHASVGPGDSQ